MNENVSGATAQRKRENSNRKPVASLDMSARVCVFVCVVRGFLKEIVNRLQKSGKASRNLAIETCFPLQK